MMIKSKMNHGTEIINSAQVSLPTHVLLLTGAKNLTTNNECSRFYKSDA